jgi:V/A-type H+/Na+-transporting ATPase subunit D
MASVRATRTELLARRHQLALAQQGQDLLEQKRAALVQELMRMVDVALQHGSELDRAAAAALDALDLATGLDGPESIHSAALAATGTGARLEVAVEGATVMGVAVPRITPLERRRGLLDCGYTLAFSSAAVDEVGDAFDDELRHLVRLAETDVRIRRLGGEIQRTARRVNALRHVIVPALLEEAYRIAAMLEEQEREDHARLKRFKRRQVQPHAVASD